VLLTGESGTGKELVARALHRSGRRSSGPFVAINCAAVPAGLLESEMFGHVRGAFTDARTDRAGLFVKATGGTLFLDEIAEMPLELQPKLLRALQERAVRPLGADAEVPYDARVIAATNHDLETAVEERRFREDLYFRINVVTVRLPPLRERREDIPVLVGHFLHKLALRERRAPAAMSPEALKLLTGYAWPGNVRELENAIERAVAVAKGNVILPSDLPPEVGGVPEPGASADTGGLLGEVGNRPTLAELERRYIQLVLSEVGGNKKKAAEKLGIDRRTLYRALERGGDLTPDPEDDE
jgi:two-component system response regulator HydG